MVEENNEELIESLITSTDCLYHGEVFQGKERYHIQILCERIELTALSKNISETYKWVDVLGAVEKRVKSLDMFELMVYPKINQVRTFKRYSFASEETKQWVKIIQHMAYYQTMPNPDDPIYRRKLKILINPHSGRGTASRVWRRIEYMLAACDLDVLRTQYRNHAAEVIKQMQISDYDAIIVVSGDGLIHEVINALCARDDGDQARMCPVSMIPGGSSNALAQILCDKSGEDVNAENCSFIAAKGNMHPFDISLMRTESGKVIYSFLSLAWAYIGDVDIESEVCRCCGAFRFDLYGFWRLLSLRRYNATVTWEDEEGEHDETGQYIYFLVCNTPYIGIGLNFAPKASIEDGMNDILFLRGNIGRRGLLQVLLREDSGRHVNLPQLNYLKASKWSLAPENNRGIYSIDGELYPTEKITVEVLNNYATVLVLSKGH